MATRRTILFSLALAGIVWVVWLIALGPTVALDRVMSNWEVALTMVFGSLIAGATSEGGGAVAFPVFTKLLAIRPEDAKVFALAIQSVGMTAAALCIVVMRVRVDWRVIRYASLGGAAGVFVGIGWTAHMLTPPAVRMLFSAMQVSFAIVLVLLNRGGGLRCQLAAISGERERLIFVAAGFVGGMMSGMVGNGIDIVTFAVLVLLFRVSEKIATPTSVVLMAINAVVGLAACQFVFGGVNQAVLGYWTAAIPVVVIGAPAGAMVCSLLRRETIVRILIALIAIELLTSLWLIPLTTEVIVTGLVTLSVFGLVNAGMYLSHRYRPHDVRPMDIPSELAS